MTKQIKYFSVLIVGLASMITGCEKNELRTTEYDLPQDKSFVRMAMFSPQAATGAITNVMIKVDSIKINGSSTAVSNGFFPATTTSADYSAINPNGLFRLTLPNTGTANDSILVFSGRLVTEPGKFYSVVLGDTGINRTLFVVDDNNIARPDSGFTNIRLINASPNAGPLTFIRVDSINATTVTRDTIARNIPFKGTSGFIRVPNKLVRYRVTTQDGVTFSQNASVNPGNSRSATLYASGFFGGTGNLTPALSVPIINQ